MQAETAAVKRKKAQCYYGKTILQKEKRQKREQVLQQQKMKTNTAWSYAGKLIPVTEKMNRIVGKLILER